ncbi:hypothetical protein A33M_0664 [Rhodovulum sp. PH10]|nr:hypothetical protein A33M_0664 [Rhodovulum sp. PH10]
MDDLFVHQLEDIYYAEQQIEKALPEMIEKAADAELKRGFKTHLGETKKQIKRLEQAFKALDRKPKGTDCPAIDGIIAEAEDIASEVEDPAVLNAALIAAAQAVEHYEITRYGTLIAWAKQLGHKDVVALLKQTLDEEVATDKKLTGMAKTAINPTAARKTTARKTGGRKPAAGKAAAGKAGARASAGRPKAAAARAKTASRTSRPAKAASRRTGRTSARG